MKIIEFPGQPSGKHPLVAQIKFLALATPDELRNMPSCPRLHQLAEEYAYSYFTERFSRMREPVAEITPFVY